MHTSVLRLNGFGVVFLGIWSWRGSELRESYEQERNYLDSSLAQATLNRQITGLPCQRSQQNWTAEVFSRLLQNGILEELWHASLCYRRLPAPLCSQISVYGEKKRLWEYLG